MKQSIRILLRVVGVAGLALLALGRADAADFPTRPIRLIVPFGGGGYGDTVARLLARAMTAELGVQVIVDLKPGGSTIIGTEVAARAPADGYTLLLISTTHAVNPSLFRKLPYDPVKDFEPVTLVDSTPFALVVNPRLPAKNLAEFIAYGKANPGRLTYGSSGPGSSINLTGELFKLATGIDMLHVPYKGSGPALIGLIGGEIDSTFTSTITAIPYIRNNQLRGLAVTSAARNSGAPELPTIAESGYPGFEASSWLGLLAPAGTPTAIVNQLQQVVVRALKAPEMVAAFKSDGAEAGGQTPEEFRRYYQAEIRKWGDVVAKAGIKPE